MVGTETSAVMRVAIARALILRPTLLLCDEPTGNLDRTTAAGVGDLLLEIHHEERATLIVVTHSLELSRRFDRCAELDSGGIVWKSQQAPTSHRDS